MVATESAANKIKAIYTCLKFGTNEYMTCGTECKESVAYHSCGIVNQQLPKKL